MLIRYGARIGLALLFVGNVWPCQAVQRAGGRLPPCPVDAEKTPRQADAQQCWFKTTRGGWRILSHDAHYDSVVYHIGADHLDDARSIASVIVNAERQTTGELMMYVYSEPLATSTRIRRVRWNATRGYETLEFAGRPPAWIVRAPE